METSQWKSDETLSLFCFFNEVYMDVCHLFSHWGSLCTETQWFYRRLSDTGRTVFGNVAWPRSAEQTGLFIDILIRYRLACCCQLLTYLHCFSFIYDNISWSQGWCSAHSEHTHTHTELINDWSRKSLITEMWLSSSRSQSEWAKEDTTHRSDQ